MRCQFSPVKIYKTTDSKHQITFSPHLDLFDKVNVVLENFLSAVDTIVYISLLRHC